MKNLTATGYVSMLGHVLGVFTGLFVARAAFFDVSAAGISQR
jgi:hypothetical protein